MLKWPVIVVMASGLGLSGCQTLDNVKKETLATVGGTGAGALLGALVCGNKYKALCALVGAGIGGFVGNQIGKKLDEADRQTLALETSKALAANTATSAPRQWSNPDTGVKGTVTVKNAESKPVQASIPVLKDRVQVTPSLDLIGETYRVDYNRLNVRGGPGTNYATVGGQLLKGQEVQVVGRVQSNPDWLLIAEDGVGTGYAFAKGLTSTGFALASDDKAVTPAGAETVQFAANSQCKIVEQQVTYADNTTDTESVRMCQQGNGTWSVS